MALNIDPVLLKESLFSAAKDATEVHLAEALDETKALHVKYLEELRAYTDNLAVLKLEIAEASTPELKMVKLQSIKLQQRSINGLVDRYQMIFQQEAIERVKEVLKTVALTIGKIAFSMAIAAV